MHISSGIYKGRILITPKGLHTRPTTGRLREALFNICRPFLEEAIFLDLFAGSGGIGLEALSNGAAHVTLVDSHRASIHAIQANVALLQVEKQTEVLCMDFLKALNYLGRHDRKFFIIYADPPYSTRDNHLLYSHQVVQAVEKLSLLQERGFLFVEESASEKPYGEPLSHLELVTTRSYGNTILYQYLCKKK